MQIQFQSGGGGGGGGGSGVGSGVVVSEDRTVVDGEGVEASDSADTLSDLRDDDDDSVSTRYDYLGSPAYY